MSATHDSNSCPSCQSNDRVEKVTSILKSQTSLTQGQMPVESVFTDSEGRVRSSTDYRNYSSSHSSSLAQELAPPPRPTGNSYGFCLNYFVFQMAGIGFFGLMFVFCGLLAFSNMIFSEMPNASQTDIASARIFGIGGAVVLIGGYIGVMLLLFFGHKYFKNKRSEEQKRIDETEGVAWEKAIRRWDNLFYCYRCDSVFIPGEQSAPARSMKSYIFKI